jgi:hypothetical protein
MKVILSILTVTGLLTGCGAQSPASKKARDWSLESSASEVDTGMIHGSFNIITTETYFNHVEAIKFANNGQCILFYGRGKKIMLCGSYQINY